MNTRLRAKWAGAAGVLALIAGAAPALGQNALGDGRALERDLRQYGQGEQPTGNAPRPNFMNEVRARNAAVTGNAPNGRSLMINSPYSDPNDFRGHLGSADLFSFQRDSQASAAPYHGTQYQNTTAFAHGLWKPATRLDTYGAASELPKTGANVRGQLPPPSRQRPNPDSATPQPSPSPLSTGGTEAGAAVTSPVGTLRSAGAFTSTVELNPALVGFREEAGGELTRVTASSLLGVRTVGKNARMTERQEAEKGPEKNAMAAMGLDASNPGPSTSAGSTTFRTTYDDLKDRLTATGAGPAPGTTTPETTVPAGQQPGKPAAKETKPGAEGTSAQPTWEERINRIRQRLEKGKGKTIEKPSGAEPAQPEKAKGPTPGAQPAEPGSPAGAGAEPEKKNPYAMAGMDEETLEIIRKAGGEAKSYTAGTPGSLFDVHLKAGEDELSKGNYFDAEERFARALAMRPNDATVQAARLNAQIGAGLYVSAATNLRMLYSQHPEVIGVHYAGATMPTENRIKAMMEELRGNIAKAKRDGMPPSEESGLLLAYVGYQKHDAAAIREGLHALHASRDGASDPLIPLLEGVWLGKESK
jgi:hypothetical protein